METSYNILAGECPYCGSYSRSYEYHKESETKLIAHCTCDDCNNEYEERYIYYCTDFEEEEE